MPQAMNCCPSGMSSTQSAKSECSRGINSTPDAMNSTRSAIHWIPSGIHSTSTAIKRMPDAMNAPGWGVNSIRLGIHSSRSPMLSGARAGEPGHRVAIGPLPRKGAWHMTDTALAAGIDAHRRSDGAPAIEGCPSRRRAVAGWPGKAGCGSRSGRVGALRVVFLTPAGTRAPACSGSPPDPAATPPPPRFPRPAPRSAASSSQAAAPSR